MSAYLHFCSLNDVNPLKPAVYDLLSFLLYLSKRLKSTGALNNYFSSVKLWVCSVPGDHAIFGAHELMVMKKGLLKCSNHMVCKAPAMTPAHLACIVKFLKTLNSVPLAAIAALLLEFVCLLSQSNLVITSCVSPHVLRFKHIAATKSHLSVVIRSSKTQYRSAGPLPYCIPASHSPICPVKSWNRYASTVNPRHGDAAFLMSDHTPVLPKPCPPSYEMLPGRSLVAHSPSVYVDRGAAQACQSSALPIQALLQAGTWRSEAFREYLSSDIVRDAPSALVSLLVSTVTV